MVRDKKEIKNIRYNWAGNRTIGGRYVNIRRKAGAVRHISQWEIPTSKVRSIVNMGSDWEMEVSQFEHTALLPHNSFVWLGHSSFIFDLGGVRLILDPVFGDIPFVKRKSRMPIHESKIDGIDLILLSHDHFDHCDKSSIKTLVENNPTIEVVAGLGIDNLIKRWCSKTAVHTLGWYQQIEHKGVTITFLPAQHWSKRGLTDGATRLWGAFMIEFENKKIYYSGDTAFSTHFEEIKTLFGEVDYAFMGIGAYTPRWFLNRNHISPYEAVKASKIMGAKRTVPMHYATFKLSREPLFDPPQIFWGEAHRHGLNVVMPCIGEVVNFF